MAKAGFYHQPTNRGDDRALCFTCNVCLVCWEPTDEPWSEHERHCPECSFVKGDNTKNVPMSVSLATSLAYSHEGMQIKFISDGSCSHYIAAYSEDGQVIIWDIQEELKIHSQFQVKLPVEIIENQDCNSSVDLAPPTSFVAWAEPENEHVTSLPKDQENNNLECTSELVEIKSGLDNNQETLVSETENGVQENHTNRENIDCRKGTEHPVEQKNEDKLIMSAISIVCSCGKDPTIAAGQNCPSFGHTATLVLALSIAKNLALPSDVTKTSVKDGTTENQYIMVYDILTTKSETLAKPLFNVDNSVELEKELLLQDAYTPSSSEDDWMYDQMAPALSDTLHSSVLQKFAEAMSGDENGSKGKNTKSKEETYKRAKFVQCLDLSDVCKGQRCKVSELVPFGDGQNLLVNLVCYGSDDNETDLASADLNCEKGKIINEQATWSNNQEVETVSKTSTESLDFTPKDSTKESQRKFCYKQSLNQSKLAVYRINISNGGRMLSSQPIRTKQFSVCDGIFTNFVALPLETHPLLIESEVHLQEQESDISSCSQLLIGAANCNIVVIHANSLDIVSKFTTGKEVTHILNCPGMDCFCACVTDGMMYFLGIRNQLTDETGLGSVESDGRYMTTECSGGSTSQRGKVN